MLVFLKQQCRALSGVAGPEDKSAFSFFPFSPCSILYVAATLFVAYKLLLGHVKPQALQAEPRKDTRVE